MSSKRSLASLMAVNEDLWGRFDKAWSGLTPVQWSRKYGKDWTLRRPAVPHGLL